VPALLAHAQFELAYLCDIREERTALLGKNAPAATCLTDYRELVSRADIDAVILALHPEISVNVAIDFLRADKAVLDEKPLACNLEDGLRVQQVIEQEKGVYQIGFVMRYSEIVRIVSEYAEKIGSPVHCRAGIFDERLDPSNHDHYQRIQEVLRQSSAMNHEGSHVIDYSQFWLGTEIIRARAKSIRTQEEFDGANMWSAQFETRDGSIFELELGWFLPHYPNSYVRLVGPKGFLNVDYVTGQGRVAINGREDSLAVQPMRQEWSIQLDHFAAAIERGTAETATVKDGLRALTMSLACEESDTTGKPVAISLDL
jgi:predicted dehydrogenase